MFYQNTDLNSDKAGRALSAFQCYFLLHFDTSHCFQIQPSLFSRDVIMLKDTLIIMCIMMDMTDVWMSGFKEKGGLSYGIVILLFVERC